MVDVLLLRKGEGQCLWVAPSALVEVCVPTWAGADSRCSDARSLDVFVGHVARTYTGQP